LYLKIDIHLKFDKSDIESFSRAIEKTNLDNMQYLEDVYGVF